jgi:hypothetical protein
MDYNIFGTGSNSRTMTMSKNNGGVIGVILVVILLAILVNVKPNYFKYLFKSLLGNLILAFAIIVIGIMDIKWGIGFAAIAFIIYQAFQISCVQVEGFSSVASTCKPGCVASNQPNGNCKLSDDKKVLNCPWECSTKPSNYNSTNCTYASECSTCSPNTTWSENAFGQWVRGTEPTYTSSTDSSTDSTGNTVATSGKPATGITSSTTSKSLWGLFPEGYPIPKTTVWPQNIINDFVEFQKVRNPNLRFDLDIIQKQATVEEVQTLLKTGKWPWSPDVVTLYKNAIAQNNIINNEPGASLMIVQSVYNQRAILELLSWNTKEGSFLLNGAIIKHTDGMPANINNLVRCGKNKETGKITMQKVVYTGYNGVNGSIVSKVTPIKNADIPNQVTGFKFLKSECNPCSALDDPADYSCPFSLNVGDGSEVSKVWQQLWGLNSTGSVTPGATKTDALSPETVSKTSSLYSSSLNKEDFPILSQLSDELMKGVSYMKITFEKPSDDIMSNTPGSQNIGAITGSSVPAIITNGTQKNKIYYGTKNMSSGL